KTIVAPSNSFVLNEEDELYVRGRLHELGALHRLQGISLQKLSPQLRERFPAEIKEIALKATGGRFTDRTVRELELRARHDVVLVGIEREGTLICDRLSAFNIEA